ncbi:Gluconokinase [Cronobacter malonaticus 681]|nr:Gluconokinase [Cronobacter malonaticus 681]
MSTTNHDHHIYILMGVSGSGKSVVASEVAHRLKAAFLDGDFLHPRRNIMKMAAGDPLNDDDRTPWLQALNDAAFAMQRTNKVSLIVCSALKKRYRDILRSGNPNLSFIWLKGDFEVIFFFFFFFGGFLKKGTSSSRKCWSPSSRRWKPRRKTKKMC